MLTEDFLSAAALGRHPDSSSSPFPMLCAQAQETLWLPRVNLGRIVLWFTVGTLWGGCRSCFCLTRGGIFTAVSVNPALGWRQRTMGQPASLEERAHMQWVTSSQENKVDSERQGTWGLPRASSNVHGCVRVHLCVRSCVHTQLTNENAWNWKSSKQRKQSSEWRDCSQDGSKFSAYNASGSGIISIWGTNE